MKMYENCELFNGRFSALTKTANELKDRLLHFIRPPEAVTENESKKRKSDRRLFLILLVRILTSKYEVNFSFLYQK